MDQTGSLLYIPSSLLVQFISLHIQKHKNLFLHFQRHFLYYYVNNNQKKKSMYTSGDKPGKGTYKCQKCGKEITLENETDVLPQCPVCGHEKWDKIG